MGRAVARLLPLVLPLAVALVVLGTAPSPAGADEPAARDAFPAPSAEAAFEFSGYVLRDGAPYARVRLSAQADPETGRWQVRDAIDPVRGGDRVLATAALDRRLALVEGTYHRRNAHGFLRGAVARVEDGYRVEHVTDEYENRLDVGGRDPLCTLAGALLFLRLLPEGPGTWDVEDLDANPSGGDAYVETMRLQVHGKAGWRVAGAVREAWIVSLTRGTQTLRLALAPGTRDLLGVEFVGLPFQFVPQGSGAVGLAEVSDDLRTPLERAVARTRRVRAALPVPKEPLDLRGRIHLAGEAPQVGVVWLRADPDSLGGRPAWSVLDSRVMRTGRAVVATEELAVLGRDLRVLRGERLDRRPEGTSRVRFEREAAGMRLVEEGVDGRALAFDVAAPPEDAAFGLVPVLLFLRQVPAAPASYLLPVWDPRFAAPPKAGSGNFTLQAADVHVDVSVEDGLLRARCRTRLGRTWDVLLEARSRRVLRIEGRMPAIRLEFAPAPEDLPALDWYDAAEGGAPATWRQAFVQFGRGYHLPAPELLAQVFHWPSMRAQAVAQGRYAADVDEATVRDAWIDVFVQMSKHRTKGDCDDLLFQIFMTSRETHHEDGSVSLSTLPAYGGHTYRLRAIDSRWYVVSIDERP